MTNRKTTKRRTIVHKALHRKLKSKTRTPLKPDVNQKPVAGPLDIPVVTHLKTKSIFYV